MLEIVEPAMSIETALPSEMMDTIELARDLIRLDTANPPGNESVIADLIESRLAKLGIVAERHAHASGRDSLVARLNGERAGKPICFCGHIDTVPVGTIQWRLGALDGTIEGGRLWGRGATDMKSGVAAMVTAFERLAVDGCDSNVMLLLCASEETGCQGAANVAKHIEKAGAVVISEPTSNNLAIGHKGVLWVKLSTVGVAAHGSMPHLGVNAINRMAEAIVGLRGLEFGVTEHQLLGLPTLNVGLIRGGSAPNMVPDYCECTVDIRLTPELDTQSALALLRTCLDDAIHIQVLLALNAVASSSSDAWIEQVHSIAQEMTAAGDKLSSVSYFTDAAVLSPAFDYPPVAIIGPGDAALAHQVDESCDVLSIWRASQLYEVLARQWI